MASWMVHLRIADLLLEEFETLEKTEFIMGNIAPDSGIPSQDWSYYTPPKEVSHFWDEHKRTQFDQFIEKYFTEDLRESYNQKQYSFFLGYLSHLVADYFWVERIVKPCKKKHEIELAEDQQKFFWKMKADWYDQDFLFLAKNPDFRAFQIYKNAAAFENTYMDIFTADAFDNRREYIVGFYSEKRENLDRDYPYLDERCMDQFVKDTVGIIVDKVPYR